MGGTWPDEWNRQKAADKKIYIVFGLIAQSFRNLVPDLPH